MNLTRLEALAADDLVREACDVPEWGGTLYLRTMTAGERGKFLDDAYPVDGAGKPSWSRADYDALLVQRTACDESGKALFDAGDVSALAAKNGAVVARIALQASRLNRLTEPVSEAAKN